MTPQTRALIEAAEAFINDVGHRPKHLALQAAISSAKAAEEDIEQQVTALKVENDRLQTSNAALRRRLENIANQYAVDCL